MSLQKLVERVSKENVFDDNNVIGDKSVAKGVDNVDFEAPARVPISNPRNFRKEGMVSDMYNDKRSRFKRQESIVTMSGFVIGGISEEEETRDQCYKTFLAV